MQQKPLFGFGISILFVILGIWLITTKSTTSDNPTLINTIGAITIIFFGGLIIFTLLKRLKK